MDALQLNCPKMFEMTQRWNLGVDIIVLNLLFANSLST